MQSRARTRPRSCPARAGRTRMPRQIASTVSPTSRLAPEHACAFILEGVALRARMLAFLDRAVFAAGYGAGGAGRVLVPEFRRAGPRRPAPAAPAKLPRWKLRVGSKPFDVGPGDRRRSPARLEARASVSSLRIAASVPRSATLNASGSASGILCVPRTTMAFRFFAPITAPPPPRPACRCGSQSMLANFTRCSPAGPMQAILPVLLAIRRPQRVVDLVGVFPDQSPARLERDPVVVDLEQRPLRRLARDHQPVIARRPQLLPEESAVVGVCEQAGRRRLKEDARAHRRRLRAGQRTHHEDERVVRIVRRRPAGPGASSSR